MLPFRNRVVGQAPGHQQKALILIAGADAGTQFAHGPAARRGGAGTHGDQAARRTKPAAAQRLAKTAMALMEGALLLARSQGEPQRVAHAAEALKRLLGVP